MVKTRVFSSFPAPVYTLSLTHWACLYDHKNLIIIRTFKWSCKQHNMINGMLYTITAVIQLREIWLKHVDFPSIPQCPHACVQPIKKKQNRSEEVVASELRYKTANMACSSRSTLHLLSYVTDPTNGLQCVNQAFPAAACLRCVCVVVCKAGVHLGLALLHKHFFSMLNPKVWSWTYNLHWAMDGSKVSWKVELNLKLFFFFN